MPQSLGSVGLAESRGGSDAFDRDARRRSGYNGLPKRRSGDDSHRPVRTAMTPGKDAPLPGPRRDHARGRPTARRPFDGRQLVARAGLPPPRDGHAPGGGPLRVDSATLPDGSARNRRGSSSSRAWSPRGSRHRRGSCPARRIDDREEAERLRQAITYYRASPGPSVPHVLFGPMTRPEWDRFHCIHAAHHLSFAIPDAPPG